MKKLLFVSVLIALIAFLVRKAMADRTEWEGLSEDDLRDRLDQRLPSQIPDEKRQAIADTIVTKMRDRGAIAEPAVDIDDTIDLSDSASESASA